MIPGRQLCTLLKHFLCLLLQMDNIMDVCVAVIKSKTLVLTLLGLWTQSANIFVKEYECIIFTLQVHARFKMKIENENRVKCRAFCLFLLLPATIPYKSKASFQSEKKSTHS